MHRMLSVKNNDLNEFLKCPQCKGYLIDSFTINECLHSFCKSCIIKYIKRKECCPVCKIAINKDRMKLFLRRDVNLQYIVYKLVPGLFKREMQRRQAFYNSRPKAVKFLKKRRIWDKEAVGEQEDEFSFIQGKHDDISLSIEYNETGLSEICESARTKDMDSNCPRTYLLCPAAMTIDLLKKFLKLKNQDCSISMIDIMYDETPLKKDMTLLDVGYIYAWRRKSPMRLFYRINKATQTAEKVPEPEAVECQVALPVEPLEAEETPNSPADRDNNLDETLVEKPPPIEPALAKSPPAQIAAIKKELFQPQFASMYTSHSTNHRESEHLEEMLVDNNQPSSQLNNQTLNNETLTITSMMQSIGSAARQSADIEKESLSAHCVVVQDKSASEMMVDHDQTEMGTGSDKENSGGLMEVKLEPEQDDKEVDESKETQVSLPNMLISTAEAIVAPLDMHKKASPIVNRTRVDSNSELNRNSDENTTTKVTKSKKNPAAPGSAGGVAKKKKDALTLNNDNNNVATNSVSSTSISKKPKATKPKKPTAKQLQLQQQQQQQNHQPFDPSNIQIKQQPVEPNILPGYYQPHDSHSQFPQIKLEKSYNPHQPFNPQQQISTFQQQIQQQFSLPPTQSLFQNTKHASASGGLPNLQNILANVPPGSNGNPLMANNFMMPMSLMNHFLNNQQQQQNWNQLKNTQLVTNALQMGNKLNPTQLFEFLQSKTSQNLSTQAQQSQNQQHYHHHHPQQQQQQQQPHNIFNSNLQQNQFYTNQYDDFKVPFTSSGYQDRAQPSPIAPHSYFNSQGNDSFKYSNMPASQYNQFYPPQQMSNNTSSSSTCSSEGLNSVESNIKENPLRSIISESCNLVNEFN